MKERHGPDLKCIGGSKEKITIPFNLVAVTILLHDYKSTSHSIFHQFSVIFVFYFSSIDIGAELGMIVMLQMIIFSNLVSVELISTNSTTSNRHSEEYCAMYDICGERSDGKVLNCPNGSPSISLMNCFSRNPKYVSNHKWECLLYRYSV